MGRGCDILGQRLTGEVAEWFKATVLKTVVHESGPWVRIPPSPPNFHIRTKTNTGDTCVCFLKRDKCYFLLPCSSQ
jgi:hypothetical protein